jgi:hypothetical protein
MPNIDKLNAVLAKIKADPKSWDQSRWFCGTAACFAGHAMLLEDCKVTTPTAGFGSFGHDVGDSDRVEMPNGAVCNVSRAAEEILDLSEDQADALFYYDNELVDLERMIEALEDNPESDLYEISRDRDIRLDEQRARARAEDWAIRTGE